MDSFKRSFGVFNPRTNTYNFPTTRSGLIVGMVRKPPLIKGFYLLINVLVEHWEPLRSTCSCSDSRSNWEEVANCFSLWDIRRWSRRPDHQPPLVSTCHWAMDGWLRNWSIVSFGTAGYQRDISNPHARSSCLVGHIISPLILSYFNYPKL